MSPAAADKPARRFTAHPGWHAVGLFIVAGWLVVLAMMFWPVDEAAGAVDLVYAGLDGALVEGEVWMGAYQQERKLGWVHSRVTRAGTGYQMFQESHLKVSVAGVAQQVESRLDVRLGGEYRLEKFEFSLRAGPLQMQARGRMTGQGIEVWLIVGGESRKRLVPMAEPPLFDLAVPYLIARQDLNAGARFRMTVFDPQTLTNRPRVVEVVGPEAVPSGGKLVPAVHLRSTTAGLRLDSWIDADGRLLKEQIQGGLVLRREEPEQAKSGVIGLDAAEEAGVGWMRAFLREQGPGPGTESP